MTCLVKPTDCNFEFCRPTRYHPALRMKVENKWRSAAMDSGTGVNLLKFSWFPAGWNWRMRFLFLLTTPLLCEMQLKTVTLVHFFHNSGSRVVDFFFLEKKMGIVATTAENRCDADDCRAWVARSTAGVTYNYFYRLKVSRDMTKTRLMADSAVIT